MSVYKLAYFVAYNNKKLNPSLYVPNLWLATRPLFYVQYIDYFSFEQMMHWTMWYHKLCF